MSLTDVSAISEVQQWPTNNFVLSGFGCSACGTNGQTTSTNRFFALVSACAITNTSRTVTCSVTYLTASQAISEFSFSLGLLNSSSQSDTITPRFTIPIDYSVAASSVAARDVTSSMRNLIYNDVNLAVYCPDCSFRGAIQVVGSLAFSRANGIMDASLANVLSMDMSLHFAFIANSPYITAFEKSLASVPATRVTVPGLFSIDPTLSFGVGANLNFAAAGSVAAGLDIERTSLQIDTNLNDMIRSDASGSNPQIIDNEISFDANVAFDGDAHLVYGVQYIIKYVSCLYLRCLIEF